MVVEPKEADQTLLALAESSTGYFSFEEGVQHLAIDSLDDKLEEEKILAQRLGDSQWLSVSKMKALQTWA